MKCIKHYDFTKMTELPDSDFNIQTGEKWANHELQQYVNDSDHILFDKNLGLILRATLKDGIYKSARINTRNKFFFQYGRVEITANVPSGKGTWPALWMMSQDGKFGHWPKSGEIDIMEHTGKNEDHVFLCLHTESYNHTRSDQYYYQTKIPGLVNQFHTYAIEWDKENIIYFIDGKEMVHYNKFDKEDTSHKGWPFDQNFFLIMNLAIGGKFGGEVDDSIFPVDFIIKEIKVYQ